MAVSEIQKLLRLQRKQLHALIQVRGVGRMTKLYDQARADLESRLAKLVREGKGKTFTAHHLRIALVQVNEGIRVFQSNLTGYLASQNPTVGALSQQQLIKSTKAMEKHFRGHAPPLAIEQAAVQRAVFRGVEPSLLNRYKRSVATYGKPVITKIRNQLSLSLMTGDTVDQAVDRVAGTSGIFAAERWRAERIVRTEMSYAFGVVKQKSMQEMAKADMPDLQKKLIATFDDRTGEDSKELHGQIKKVNEPFIWKRKNAAGAVVETIEYMQPPNRPNDREIVIPWRPSWVESKPTEPLSDVP